MRLGIRGGGGECVVVEGILGGEQVLLPFVSTGRGYSVLASMVHHEGKEVQHAVTHCNTLQHTATHWMCDMVTWLIAA